MRQSPRVSNPEITPIPITKRGNDAYRATNLSWGIIHPRTNLTLVSNSNAMLQLSYHSTSQDLPQSFTGAVFLPQTLSLDFDEASTKEILLGS